MATIKLPANLRPLAGDKSKILVGGEDVRTVLSGLWQQYPDVRERLIDADGNVLSYVNVFLNGASIRELDGLDTPVSDDAEILIVTALAGG